MNCARARQYIHQAIDDELSPSRLRHLGRHLAGCSACERFHRELIALRSATGRLAALSAAPVQPPRMLDIPSRKPAPWIRVGAVAAAVLLAIGLLRIATGMMSSPTAPTARQEVVTPDETDAHIAQAADSNVPVYVEVAPDPDIMVIEKSTQHRDITILWVYPIVRTAEVSPDSSQTLDSSTQGAEL